MTILNGFEYAESTQVYSKFLLQSFILLPQYRLCILFIVCDYRLTLFDLCDFFSQAVQSLENDITERGNVERCTKLRIREDTVTHQFKETCYSHHLPTLRGLSG